MPKDYFANQGPRTYPIGHDFSDYDVKQDIGRAQEDKQDRRQLIDSAFPSKGTTQPVSSGSQSLAPSKDNN